LNILLDNRDIVSNTKIGTNHWKEFHLHLRYYHLYIFVSTKAYITRVLKSVLIFHGMDLQTISTLIYYSNYCIAPLNIRLKNCIRGGLKQNHKSDSTFDFVQKENKHKHSQVWWAFNMQLLTKYSFKIKWLSDTSIGHIFFILLLNSVVKHKNREIRSWKMDKYACSLLFKTETYKCNHYLNK
jgi:hypothetical protein